MATRRSKLLPDLESPAPDAQSERAPLVHIEPAEGGWTLRVGSRVEATFDDQDKAVRAGMRRARKLSARLFYHRPDGRIQEAETSEAAEMLLDLMQSIYDRNHPPAK